MRDNANYTALIIDDEESIRRTLAEVLEDEGWHVTRAENGQAGLRELAKFAPDLIFLDVLMPGMDGIETLQKIMQMNSKIPVVIMSGHGTIETAVKATKIGAFDFLEKPLSLDMIFPLLEHAKEIKSRAEQSSKARESIDLIGKSPAIMQIKRQIQLVAARNAWVLITGENGTGKEVVARQIHDRSTRSKKPFVAVNCAAIPEDLIESELFGYAKGAFTNAVSSKKGKFEIAHQGTIFLDEIGDMSLRTQAKILRILQEQRFERLGDTTVIQVDVRVLAATNKDLKELIKQGQFREDLYYRLNVVPFHLPPLRERGADVVELAHFFLSELAKDLGTRAKDISQDGVQVLREYSWPGNVRELRNLLERICVTTDALTIGEDILREYLNLEPRSLEYIPSDAPSQSNFKQAKVEFERAFLLSKLEENQWNVTKTADAIGLERSHLHRKIKLFGIELKFKG